MIAFTPPTPQMAACPAARLPACLPAWLQICLLF
eukprot:SAG22_NODE_6360_length_866_cov_0.844850_2_plen_33_part_01